MSGVSLPLSEVPDADLHVQVADLAQQLGFVSALDVSRILLTIPIRYQSDLPWTPHKIWVDAGPLDETEWRAIKQELQRRRPAPEGSDDHEHPSQETWSDEERGTIGPVPLGDGDACYVPPPEVGPSGDDARRPGARYIVGSLLGKGGAGRVFRAYDRTLQRVVALKVPLSAGSESTLQHLDTEARTTALLEHPNIVPIYDMGVLPSGEHFYTMKRISGRSLRDVLRDVKIGKRETLQRWTELELLRIFVEVCRAVEFAHHRNTLHRDLKPENIMLGDFGEVLVMDWGLAVKNDYGNNSAGEGPTVGTPAYMSPEQASGHREIDERSDVYTLGVILYEILTLSVPSKRDTVFETMLAVASDPVLPPSKVTNRAMAYELDDIVMRALAKAPDERYASVREFRNDVAVYLLGRQPKSAERCYREAEEALLLYDRTSEDLERARRRVSQLAARRPEDATLDESREYWRAQDALVKVDQELNELVERALGLLFRTIALNPEHPHASEALASLAYRRFVDAERERDQRNADFFAASTREFDTHGHYTRLMDGPTTLDINIDAPGYQAFLRPMETYNHDLALQSVRSIGEAPVHLGTLPRGSWLLTLKKLGEPAVRLPLFARPQAPLIVKVETLRARKLPKGFIYANEGESVIGGDSQALDSLRFRIQTVPAFAAAATHVTIDDYLEWLRYLDEQGKNLAETHLPVVGNGAPLIRRFEDGSLRPCPNAMRHLTQDWDPSRHYPIVGIRAQDAFAYAAWKSRKEGRRYRLPSELEYERITRGADGRFFPWGEHFDASLCSMLTTHPTRHQLRPIGAFFSDVGPYGHRDLAGNVRELCTHESGNGVTLRGGSWMTGAQACRGASRTTLHAERRRDDVSFRLVCEV